MSRIILNLAIFSCILVIGLSSCKDDEPTKYKLSFAEATRTVNEADGNITVELTLDKPAPEDITIEYTLEGTATEASVAEANDEYPDYGIEDVGEIEIEKGETTGSIKIILVSDGDLENDETIIIKLQEVDVKNIEFVAGEQMEITVKQEDGVIVALEWPAASTSGVADMDLLVRIGQTASSVSYDGIVTGSVYRGFDSNFEAVFIPKAYVGTLFGLPYSNTTFGLTYTYYDGSLDPLNFKVTFIDVVNGAVESQDQRQVFEGTYTSSNKNKWANNAPPTIIAQTFQNNGSQFSNISGITVQTTSSRFTTPQDASKIVSTGKAYNFSNTKRFISNDMLKQLGIR